jgi:hypothetical protein
MRQRGLILATARERRGARQVAGGFEGCAAKSVVVVADESLIDEMRTALRGDRERAEIRRHASGPVTAPTRVEMEPPTNVTRRGLLARLARLRRQT